MSWPHSGQGTGPGSQSAWVELYYILMLDFTDSLVSNPTFAIFWFCDLNTFLDLPMLHFRFLLNVELIL